MKHFRHMATALARMWGIITNINESAAMIVDLHCHSTASDGALAPAVLVTRAHERGVRLLALTDHDTPRAGWAHAAQRRLWICN